MRRFISVLCFVFLLFVCAVPAFSAQPNRIRVGVMGFESRTDGVTQRQAEAITDIFTRHLANSRSLAVFERQQLARIGEEIKLGMSGLVDINTAVEVGRIAGLQYMLMGSVTGLAQKASGGVIPIPIGRGWGGIATGSNEVQATLDARVVEVATGRIMLAISETGSSTASASGITFSGVGYAEAEFGGLEGRAIEDAVSRLAHQIRSSIGGESSHVLSVSGNSITIDVGSSTGAKVGDLYLVYADGRVITNIHNEIIGHEKINLAVIRVRDASGSHSTCVVVDGGGSASLVRRGDKIEPITQARSREMARNKSFVSSRPATSSGTFEQIFAGGGGNTTATTTTPAANQVSQTPTDNRLAQIASDSPSGQPTQSTQPAQTDRREVAGIDPNTSTDARIVQTYGLAPGAANMLGIKHRGAANKFNNRNFRGALADYKAIADEFSMDYLAAYWAGVAAHRLGRNHAAESLEWIEKALAINPNYKPAADFKKNTLRR